jgi:hypothetical protein
MDSHEPNAPAHFARALAAAVYDKNQVMQTHSFRSELGIGEYLQLNAADELVALPCPRVRL